MTLSQPLRVLQLVLGQVLSHCCLLYVKMGVVHSLYETLTGVWMGNSIQELGTVAYLLWHKLENEGLFFFFFNH